MKFCLLWSVAFNTLAGARANIARAHDYCFVLYNCGTWQRCAAATVSPQSGCVCVSMCAPKSVAGHTGVCACSRACELEIDIYCLSHMRRACAKLRIICATERVCVCVCVHCAHLPTVQIVAVVSENDLCELELTSLTNNVRLKLALIY